jgi:hypothetical protein
MCPIFLRPAKIRSIFFQGERAGARAELLRKGSLASTSAAEDHDARHR